MSSPPSNSRESLQPLEYSSPVPPRPGVLTAVGIISIVLGLISILASLGGVMQGISYIWMSHMQFPTVAVTPTTMPAGAIATGGAAGSNPTMTFTYTVAGGQTVATTSPATAPAAPFQFHISRGASILTITESGLSLCLAVVLVVAGILVLRNSPRSPGLHRFYAVLKMPLVLASAYATWWTFTGLMSGFAATPGAGSAAASSAFSLMAILQAVLWAGFALIYPIALLIVFSTRTATEYFNTLQSGAIR